MRKKAFSVLALGAVISFAYVGCTIESPPSGPTIVNVTQVQGGGPSTTSTPTAAPGAGGAIVFVRTGFFGGRCKPGDGEVRNGQPMKVECVGFATATPLGPNDEKLEPAVHGYECSWNAVDTAGSNVVRLQSAGDNPFNRDVVAVNPGRARITATVKGVVGSFDVEVR
jgi:hypothetical protein